MKKIAQTKRIVLSNGDGPRVVLKRPPRQRLIVGPRFTAFSGKARLVEPADFDLPPPKPDPLKRVNTARRKIQKRFSKAAHDATAGKLDWIDQLDVLEEVYSILCEWRRSGWIIGAESLLRRLAQGRIGSQSNLSLVLLRSGLPDLSPKRASKWAAALELANHQSVSSGSLGGFFAKFGGIEGAARRMAQLRARGELK